MGVALLFSFYVGLLFHALRADPNLAPLGHDLLIPLARGLRIQYLTSVALVVGAFTLSLRVFPHVHISWRDAFTGGCIGAGLWEIGRRFFLWYLANLAQFYVVYGSLGALVAVMVWIYFSATIFLSPPSASSSCSAGRAPRWLMPARYSSRRSARRTQQAAALFVGEGGPPGQGTQTGLRRHAHPGGTTARADDEPSAIAAPSTRRPHATRTRSRSYTRAGSPRDQPSRRHRPWCRSDRRRRAP
jgi:hypothetical protein